jgi:FkbM family methyltransferase
MSTLRNLLIATSLFRPARALRRAFHGAAARRHVAAVDAFYRALVPPGALAFDVGANVGHVSEPLLRIGARVVAIEPQPECLAELRARCGGHRGFTALQAVVGAAPGTATLYLRRHHAASSLRRDWLGEPVGTLDVQVRTLAGLIERYGIPAYCKVDVEGTEEAVFATLAHPLPLVSFEYHRAELDRAARCVAMLAAGHEAEVNLTHTGLPRFSLPEWMPAGEFLRTLDARLGGSASSAYGDVWVRAREPA